jgi:hypothetical protein
MKRYTLSFIGAIVLSLVTISALGQQNNGCDFCCMCDPVYPWICWLPESPLLIKLASGPWQLTGLDDPVQFDIRAEGHKLTMGWTASGADIAFLALDRNGNGMVDDGSELFGNATPLPNVKRAPDGFVALAQYDENHDAVIDKSDRIWNSLLLWIDRNHDGISQSNELTPISASAITAIRLANHWTGRHDSSGNQFRYEALVRIGNRFEAFYDVYFATIMPAR